MKPEKTKKQTSNAIITKAYQLKAIREGQNRLKTFQPSLIRIRPKMKWSVKAYFEKDDFR